MPVWLAYVDESYNDRLFCLSAILIRHSEWAECFRLIKDFRVGLKRDYSIPLSYEIHAHEFVGGRGRPTDQRIITKWERSRIFRQSLCTIASFPKVMLFNVCLEKRGRKDPQVDAWDRLVNRVERTMAELEQSEAKRRDALMAKIPPGTFTAAELSLMQARLKTYKPMTLFIADEGHEYDITRALRKMRVINFIPSQYGAWADGKSSKNIVASHIIEDPVFKPSVRSYFVQMADCLSFSLLKREAEPTQNVSKYHLHEMFEECCESACYKQATRKDPLGIVRH